MIINLRNLSQDAIIWGEEGMWPYCHGIFYVTSVLRTLKNNQGDSWRLRKFRNAWQKTEVKNGGTGKSLIAYIVFL